MNKKSIAKLLSLLMVLNISLSTFHASGTANVDRNMDKAFINTSRTSNKKLLGTLLGLGLPIGAAVILSLSAKNRQSQHDDDRLPFEKRGINSLSTKEKQLLENFFLCHNVGVLNDENLNRKFGQNGDTPLIYAIYSNNVPDNQRLVLVTALINAKADVDAKNNYDQTALMWAAQYDKSGDIAQKLIDAGAKLDLQNKVKMTALMIAIDRGNEAVATRLIEKGAKLDLQNKENWTALMIAIDRGNEAVAKKLINAKDINLTLKNIYNKTALNIAEEKGYNNIAALIREKQAEILARAHGDE